jgi:LuxR family glucitol operon transcriptional activator
MPAHKLLMAMAMFLKDPVREAIAYTAGLAADANAVEDGLAQLLQLSLISQHEGRYRMLPLTREYALTELSTCSEFERKARRQWVEWYMNFTNQYGGYDWTEWHIQFDRIEEEWENLLAVFHWCAANEDYYAIRSFWHSGGVLKVAYIYGYWDDLLTWLNWLTEAAERRGDWSIVVSATMEIGSTLTHMGRLEEADRFLRRAWDLHEHADARIQVEVMQIIARLRTFQKQYAEAQHLLDQANAFLEKTQLHEPEYSRKWINNQRYYGELCYKKQDFEQAEMYFREVLERAQMIGRQRSIISSQNYLANIAIAQNRLDEAEDLLQTGLTVCERNKDKRRTAYYKCSFAYLYRKLGDLSEARHWAKEAFDGFERLGMRLEMEEMHAFLQELQG